MIAASSRVGFGAKVSDELVTEASPSIASGRNRNARILLRRPPQREDRSRHHYSESEIAALPALGGPGVSALQSGLRTMLKEHACAARYVESRLGYRTAHLPALPIVIY